MSWKFDLAEKSPGHYLCVGLRDSGHTVKATGGETEVGRIFELAFDLEIELRTDLSRALFEVTRAAKPRWSSRYDDHAFGSWLVESKERRGDRVVYDGKEYWLEVYSEKQGLEFQSPLGTGKELDRAFFEVLASLSA